MGWEGLQLRVGGSTTNHCRELHDSTPFLTAGTKFLLFNHLQKILCLVLSILWISVEPHSSWFIFPAPDYP